jgi:hypothetical protein
MALKEHAMKSMMTAAAILILGLSACAQPRDSVPIVVRDSTGTNTDVASARARDAGRAAGAGGSHAPGSTGLGSGTMGVEGSAASGSVR